MTDEVLCEKMKQGSRAALDALILRLTPCVSAAAWRVLAPSSAAREDLEEVVSDVFLALWRHAEEVDPARLRPWLAAVARRRAIDRLRTLSPAAPLPEWEADRAPGPEEEALRRERAQRLWQAVDALEEPDRTLFLRHYYEGDKVRDVARDLDMSTSAAKTRLHRGRKRLRALLAEEGEETS